MIKTEPRKNTNIGISVFKLRIRRYNSLEESRVVFGQRATKKWREKPRIVKLD